MTVALNEDDDDKDLCDAIVDCWPECRFAKDMQEKIKHYRLTGRQRDALENIWNEKIPAFAKAEAGYDEGEWC